LEPLDSLHTLTNRGIFCDRFIAGFKNYVYHPPAVNSTLMHERVSMAKWKEIAKRGLVDVGRVVSTSSETRTVILCYHSVHPSISFRSATPEVFESHLQWLQDHCCLVSLKSLLESQGGKPVGARPRVAITFDDGFRDNYEEAFPLLQKYEAPATFFVTIGFLDRVAGARVQLNARPEELQPLTWEQVREMQAAGMEIGTHSYSHPNLAALTSEQLHREIADTKVVLEERIGQRVDGIAYPYGKRRHYNARVLEAVQKAGYQYGAAICFRGVRPRDSRWALPRFFVAQDSVEQLQDKISGAYDIIGRFQDAVPLWLSRLVSPRDY
jgi:peptidoglycan/xylan/chitin deacetylase (PgdA/CDA1 family)